MQVLSAVRWLKAHNHLYADVEIALPDLWASPETEHDNHLPASSTLDLSDEESEELVDALRSVGDGVSTDTSASDSEVMLADEPHAQRSDVHLRECLANERVTQQVLRDIPTFTDPMNDKYFYEKSFPHLFPYGVGGPGDHQDGRGHGISNAEKHAGVMLQRGFDRRYQQYAPYYFTAYAYKTRRSIGGIVSVATRVNSTQQNSADDVLTEGIVPIDELEGNEEQDTLTAGSVRAIIRGEMANGTNLLQNKKIQSLLSRLVPFSKSLPGSPLHIRLERNRLLGLLSSPVVKNDGHAGWFMSFSSAEPYHDDLFRLIAAGT